MKIKVILLTIITIGFILRIVDINDNPPSLYGDELTITLDANSLLHTGKDQLGNYFPLTFEMGAGRPAGYVYLSIPFVALFGPTALGVRLLSVLSGMGMVFLMYLLGKEIFSRRVGVIAAAVTAFSPWDISLSRASFEAHLALLLALLGIYFFIRAKEKAFLYVLSAISFGLTLHTYPTYKLTLPLFIPLLVWYQWGRGFPGKDKKYFFAAAVIFLLLGIAALSQTFIASSETRFAEINIFSQQNLKEPIEQKINYERTLTQLPQEFAKYFHNKGVEYMKVFIENYLQNFSLDFLILHGDRNPRHNMATMGQIYAVEILLILIGTLNFWHSNKRTMIFLLGWIALAPFATALVGSPHALRNSLMLPPLLLLSTLGLGVIMDSRKKIIFLMLVIGFSVQFIFFTQKLYFLAPNQFSGFWAYPGKLASEVAVSNKDKYDYVIIADRIDAVEFAYPVYAKLDPEMIISQNKHRTSLNSYDFKKFDNVYVGSIPDTLIKTFLSGLNGSFLYIGLPTDAKFLENYEILQGPDKKDAVLIYYLQ